MSEYDLQLLMLLLESGTMSVDEARQIIEDRAIEEELKKTSLGKELF
jgi:hypothetical protein